MVSVAGAQYPAWHHSATLYILTTPDGANLPASATESNFPLLVRLNSWNFTFGEAQPGGEDICFASGTGTSLAYQIEQLDPASGTACIWVRIPNIKGNARQGIKIRRRKRGVLPAHRVHAVPR